MWSSDPPGPFVPGYVYAPWIPSGSPAAHNSSRKIVQVVMNARLKSCIIEVDDADPGVPDVPLAWRRAGGTAINGVMMFVVESDCAAGDAGEQEDQEGSKYFFRCEDAPAKRPLGRIKHVVVAL